MIGPLVAAIVANVLAAGAPITEVSEGVPYRGSRSSSRTGANKAMCLCAPGWMYAILSPHGDGHSLDSYAEPNTLLGGSYERDAC